jgi:hypothetical protein
MPKMRITEIVAVAEPPLTPGIETVPETATGVPVEGLTIKAPEVSDPLL